MIRAARAARGLDEAPALLRRAWRIKEWPHAPIDEMPAREYRQMVTLERVFLTVRNFSATTNAAELARRDPDGWRIMVWLRSLEHE